LKVLVFELNPGIRAVIARALFLRGHESVSVDDPGIALAHWDIDEYPLVILGWQDDGSTLDACTRIREAPDGADAVLVVVGSSIHPRHIAQLASVADDVVTPETEFLTTRLAVAERRMADVEQRRAAALHLAYQALHDVLTGLPNRALLSDRLSQSLRTAQRQKDSLGVCLIDLDRFKAVNDTYGHHVGDLVLKEVAARLRTALRASDTVARIGGDEMAIVLTSIGDTENAVAIAGKIAQVICEPCVFAGQQVTVGASIGLAVFPAHGSDGDTLLLRADAAMYAAKRAGGGVALYAPDMPDAPLVVAAPAVNGDASRDLGRQAPTLTGTLRGVNRRSFAELLRTIGQDLDRTGGHPTAIICEPNGYRVRENGSSEGTERWFPIEELVRESVSRALRRQAE